ncbi:hypothetical protein [Arthrobacter sp. GAS37]|uniref:hypothetical protein n=1 Tax=Arthrobacter sp. GAS37 TaxID=3156261 RepID=UPI00385032D6
MGFYPQRDLLAMAAKELIDTLTKATHPTPTNSARTATPQEGTRLGSAGTAWFQGVDGNLRRWFEVYDGARHLDGDVHFLCGSVAGTTAGCQTRRHT